MRRLGEEATRELGDGPSRVKKIGRSSNRNANAQDQVSSSSASTSCLYLFSVTRVRMSHRLTTVESKLVEKEFEISKLREENQSLMDTVEKISRSSQVKQEVGKYMFSCTYLAERNPCLGIETQ